MHANGAGIDSFALCDHNVKRQCADLANTCLCYSCTALDADLHHGQNSRVNACMAGFASRKAWHSSPSGSEASRVYEQQGGLLLPIAVAGAGAGADVRADAGLAARTNALASLPSASCHPAGSVLGSRPASDTV